MRNPELRRDLPERGIETRRIMRMGMRMTARPALASEADARQVAVYRQMTPSQRLGLAMQMNQSMRDLMDSGLRATHPHFTPAERRQEIARRIRHARG